MEKKKSVLPKMLGSLIVLAMAAAVVLTQSMYSINEQEEAVVTTFGNPNTVSQPGLHFKIPFIQQVQKVSTTINGFPIGYDLVTDASIESESLMITSDYNFVNVDFFVEYQVSENLGAELHS